MVVDYIERDFFEFDFFQSFDKLPCLEKCFASDKNINLDILNSLIDLNDNLSFAFFNLFLTSEEKQNLANFSSNKFQNNQITKISSVTNKNVNFNEFLVLESLKELGDIGFVDSNYDAVSKLIVRIVSAISGNIDGNLDLYIRTTPPINKDCNFWHIDKDFINDSGNEKVSRRFVIPLVGNGTFYQKINSITRNQFFNYSSSLPGYWGHDYGECTGEDVISKIFSNRSFQITKSGYGSVHYLGLNGAMHAEPSISNSRLVLIINEIKR